MITPQKQTQQTPDNQAPLTPLADFRKNGRAPVEMNHLIFYHKDSLVEDGASASIFLLMGNPSGCGHYYGSDCVRSPFDKYRSPGDPPYTG